MELNGPWRAVVADEDLRRVYPEPGFDDGSWATIDVPGHWRSTDAFDSSDGPLLYRTRFETDRPATEERAWLTLDGAFYQTDVWLDGSYVGDTEGYFFPHTFEVTEQLRDRSEHVLGIEVCCPRQTDRKTKRAITGVFQHWDCFDPDWNPGGLWRPVRVERTGPVRLSRLRVLCSDATAERAVLRLRAVLDASESGTVELRTTVGLDAEQRTEQRLAAGENRVEWTVTVENPRLWWPHALGAQDLVDVAVEVTLADRGVPSDRREVRTGLRQVRMRDWVFTINGERLFLKGTNHGPTRMQLAEATPAELERDVVLAKETGLDLLRLHAHVSRPEIYAAADRHGLLLWQDMPLQWGYARGIRKQAARQAREAVDLLGHHPSIVLWCAHNEPMTLDLEPGGEFDPKKLAMEMVRQQQLPTWNKTILDASVHRALAKSDSTRPSIPHSGVFPHPGSGGTDSHLYFGWYWGHERKLPAVLARWPRLARFVSEFGAQAVPASADFMEPERWPDLDWDRLAHTHALQRRFFAEQGLDPAEFPSFDAWRSATQRHQATVIRFQVETMRRLKYRPTGGFAQFCFGDGHPAVTWSVLDHERNPKLGHEALAAACAPVIVVADRPEAVYRPGDAISLDVHVVNDLREPFEATVTARLDMAGTAAEWTWGGEVAADSCVRVGTVQAVAPEADGRLVLELSMESQAAKATATYDSEIVSL